MVSAFTIAAIKLKVGDQDKAQDPHPEAAYVKPTELVPDEPAGWANLGLYYLRRDRLKDAEQALKTAKRLAAQNGRIEALEGFLADKNNHLDQAVEHLRTATKLDPNDVQVRYALIRMLDRTPGNAEAARVEQLQGIVAAQPLNMRALVELAVAEAKTGQFDQALGALTKMRPFEDHWPQPIRTAYQEALAANRQHSHEDAYSKTFIFKNVSVQTPEYAVGSLQLSPAVDYYSSQQSGLLDPMERFVVLKNPDPTPSAPDTALSFAMSPVASENSARWSMVREVCLVPDMDSEEASRFSLPETPRGPAFLVRASGSNISLASGNKRVSLPFPGGPQQTPPGPNGMLFADVAYHFRPDIVVAGAGGLRIFVAKHGLTFEDITPSTGLPPAVTAHPYTGVWAADIDSDGDLDLVLGTTTGRVSVLRNNGNQTFQAITPFGQVSGLHDFAYGDLDGDGVADAVLVDGSGKLHVMQNLRSGVFKEWSLPAGFEHVAAVALTDIERKGTLNVIALLSDGSVKSLAKGPGNGAWTAASLTTWTSPPADRSARIFWADLDLNGSPDLVATGSQGTQVWLSDGRGGLSPLPAMPDLRQAAAAEPNTEGSGANGRIDLVGLDAQGRVVRGANHGTKQYGWHAMRPRADHVAEHDSSVTGTHRINTFGVGGIASIRAGLLVESVPIQGDQVLFGLGDNAAGDYVLMEWPNGTVNGQFAPQRNSSEEALQRLTGSCPWLFAWNGRRMEFVTDILWSSPLGLRINAQNTAGVASTRDWVNVRGDQLAPKDGYYDLRITAELWETHFFDMVRLMTVDHPAGTSVSVDERFSVPPLKPELHEMTPPEPVRRATDDRGQDVTDLVRTRDWRYLDVGRGEYQGVTRDHYVEVQLDPSVSDRRGEGAADLRIPSRGRLGRPQGRRGDARIRSHDSRLTSHDWPLFLVAQGWVHPTDSSINLALGQGKHELPRDLCLEVPDGKGGWRVAVPHLGFPAGKNKTMLIDLSGVQAFRRSGDGKPMRLRLRTNMEVYWDFLGTARALPASNLRVREISPEVADLRYRGFSATRQANDWSPELPDYNDVARTGQMWRDLVGYYTRFGDVRELLASVDDRYVILNAGDEIALRFAAPPPPPPGWVRDFVFVSDGWEKDGNLNTGFSATVLPLPSHDNPAYSRPPTTLEDDPVYRKHARDWQVYHTRYVTPYAVTHAFRPAAGEP